MNLFLCLIPIIPYQYYVKLSPYVYKMTIIIIVMFIDKLPLRPGHGSQTSFRGPYAAHHYFVCDQRLYSK
jgi:hypothetical protein